jgi:hypothetical protein
VKKYAEHRFKIKKTEIAFPGHNMGFTTIYFIYLILVLFICLFTSGISGAWKRGKMERNSKGI